MDEEWKIVNGFPRYQVSTHGRLVFIPRKMILEGSLSRQGYRKAELASNDGRRKTLLVHRIVADAFIENPDAKPTVHHKNHRRDDNNVCNLEWATIREQNGQRRLKEGYCRKGGGARMIIFKDGHEIPVFSWAHAQRETGVDLTSGNPRRDIMRSAIIGASVTGECIFGCLWRSMDAELDNEQWSDIDGIQVSDRGRLMREGGILNGAPGNGYRTVCLPSRKTEYVHRLVAKAFVPNPDGKPCVNHIDSNPLNNNASNLEWVTVQENNMHKTLFHQEKRRRLG